MIHRRNEKKKSKFQERLDTVVKQHNENYHEDSGDPGDPESQSAQRTWFPCSITAPPYYVPVDIWVDNNILENWHRVSDGDRDYYCNSKDNSIVTNPDNWSKRPGVIYPPYEPLTMEDVNRMREPTADIPILTTNEVQEIIATLERTMARRSRSMMPHIEYNAAIEDCITIIETTLKLKTRTKRITP